VTVGEGGGVLAAARVVHILAVNAVLGIGTVGAVFAIGAWGRVGVSLSAIRYAIERKSGENHLPAV
jgi:hypothetical protein